MIKRSHIRQFLAVVDAGSFTQAAMRVRVTQPTLSTGIAELERLVGGALFIRSRRQVRLTEAGGRFLPIARELERGFRLADGFGRVGNDDWPSLKLGAIRSVSGVFLQSLVAALTPNYGVELVEGSDSELRAALGSGRVHAALTLLRPDEAGAHVVPLISEPYVMLVGAGHHLARKGEVEPEELAAEIMIARRSCELLDTTSRFFSQRGVRPRFALRSDSDDRCVRMVAAGMGITTAPSSLAIEGTVPVRVVGYDFVRRVGLLIDPAWMVPDDARRRLCDISAAMT
ncbi:MAG: LysR family transcriptional regulator [Sphingopyxis sp.]|uniref:LysR family transcriptional regulator n=1 Tax=Sphingopyxis sp. TaxID=1908224 RepID=UPI002ABAC649|nr:LysR family transcriptional regulator [Sphingopyxis sp.]MDZ3831870.1 LysR family transcriptional regulator [Sphingopyxis sp.]